MAARIGVEARRRRGVDVLDVVLVLAVGRPEVFRVLDLAFRKRAAVDAGQDRLRIVAKRNAEVVDQLEHPVGGDLRLQIEGKKGKLVFHTTYHLIK